MTALANTPAAWSERACARSPLEAVGWTKSGQAERFAKVLEILDPQPGETLLDYGCGTGALADHTPPGVIYRGYDWSEGMIARAQREHAHRHFTTTEPDDPVDLIACIGTFNLPGTKPETWETLKRLWNLGPRALIVSLYAGTDDRCLIYEPAETHAALKELAWCVTVGQWRSNDLIGVVRR